MEGPVADAVLKLLQYFHNPELVGSLLLLYVVHVVGFTVNIPHLFLNGLKFIVAPTEEAVLRIRSDAKGPRPEPLGQLDREGKDANAYDKMDALGLARMEVSRGTLGGLMYFPQYEGMVLWSVIALGNFVIAQGSRCAIPTQAPLGWASLTLCGALLRCWWCNVRLIYLLGLNNDYSKFALLSGFCGLFAAAAVAAMLPPAFLAFDVRAAAAALHAWGVAVRGGRDAAGPPGGVSAVVSREDFLAMFLPTVAVVSACVTAAAALPAIRFSQYFSRALGSGSGATLVYRALLVADGVLPWLASLVWITEVPLLVLGERWRGGDAGGALALRVGVTGLAAWARLAVGKLQLQAYLEGVKESVLVDLREKKVDSQAVRSKFDARLQYLVIAAAQYAAPALTVLFSLALLVHISDGATGDDLVSGTGRGAGLGVCDAARRVVGLESWATAFSAAAGTTEAPNSGAAVGGGAALGLGGGGLAAFVSTIPEIPEAFWSGVAGFLAWWACLSWAVTYAVGVAFWFVFPEDVSVTERVPTDRTTKGKKERVKGKAKAKGGGKGVGAGGMG
ncbi:unnamed protein product [Ectocarpus sp. CCAP 1310/34]|nr:unnamed protein product [Ectocarpus sp. CCAP 1310/34]